MLTDAHCHPYNLKDYFPPAEEERQRLGVMCAASATTIEEFEYCEQLSKQAKEGGAMLLPCFAIHPQMPGIKREERKEKREKGEERGTTSDEDLAIVSDLAAQGRLAAIGETGFDLFNAAFRETEQVQEQLFAVHLEAALRYGLPLVIHARRAMHKIFAASDQLKKCRSVIFHSWPGTAGEGEALMRRGVNVYFSFGCTIMLNHREAMRCCATFPADRILTETDAPFQAPRSKAFSTYADLPRILETAAALRRESGTTGTTAEELEMIIENNFKAAFAIR